MATFPNAGAALASQLIKAIDYATCDMSQLPPLYGAASHFVPNPRTLAGFEASDHLHSTMTRLDRSRPLQRALAVNINGSVLG